MKDGRLGRIVTVLKAVPGLARLVSDGAAPGEDAVIGALAARTKDLLEGEDFEVSTDGAFVTISGIGGFTGKTNILMPMFLWRAALPPKEKLKLVFGSASERLQEFLSSAYGRPWPAAGAKAHVTVSDDMVSVWWGGEHEADAVARFEPISREELGI